MGGNSKNSIQKYREHARFPALDSFGLLYNSVTNAYNFKPLHHDGKITGLAAFGSHSQAVDVLLRYVKVENSVPRIKQAKNLKDRFLRKILKQIGLTTLAKKA